jgi:RNA polymerase sigma-70 factor, ECF subfamily
VAMAEGPERGLELLEDPELAGALDGYQWFWSARADLRRRAGQRKQAMKEYEQALGLATNPVERRFLEGRLAELAD